MEDSIKYTHSDTIHSVQSPKEIVPIIIQLFKPKSIIDVGCGIGTFLKIFELNGIDDIVGLDGNWVDKNLLLIKPEKIITQNLEEKFSLDKRFDVVLCLEVAEHLSADSAPSLVKSLTNLGDIIIFSAAIPNQGGQNHINEQAPQYWENLFKTHGYSFYDIIRPLIWHNPNIDWWYKQNIFVVINDKKQLYIPPLSSKKIEYIIHPLAYDYRVHRLKNLISKYGLRSKVYDDADYEDPSIHDAFIFLFNTLKHKIREWKKAFYPRS